MGDRWAMPRIALLISVLGSSVMLALAPGVAAQRDTQPSIADAAVTDMSAQRRMRPQIRVQPRRYPYRTFHSFYPLPYQYQYPGPNGVRQCVNRYVTEYRPSGTVVVLHMRCWWVQG